LPKWRSTFEKEWLHPAGDLLALMVFSLAVVALVEAVNQLGEHHAQHAA
jgi:hypothetical protein